MWWTYTISERDRLIARRCYFRVLTASLKGLVRPYWNVVRIGTYHLYWHHICLQPFFNAMTHNLSPKQKSKQVASKFFIVFSEKHSNLFRGFLYLCFHQSSFLCKNLHHGIAHLWYFFVRLLSFAWLGNDNLILVVTNLWFEVSICLLKPVQLFLYFPQLSKIIVSSHRSSTKTRSTHNSSSLSKSYHIPRCHVVITHL